MLNCLTLTYTMIHRHRGGRGCARRTFLKAGLGATAALAGASRSWAQAPPVPPSLLRLDGTLPVLPPRTGTMKMGAPRRPDGRVLAVDSRSLSVDGRPWLPVMGEFHYSRYPEDEWRGELLKMKAGGIDIAATYVFWIHHEETEGSFDWTGRRHLRRFVEECRDAGLQIVVRCGPWCHGEVRNGGLPDWILGKSFPTRSDDPGYLAAVRRLYGEIAAQLRGLLWKEGGPVVGIQCENEYGGPAQHLLTLKGIAQEAGLDVPLYTRTGWPKLKTAMPPGELLPLFGAYAEGFWDRELTAMPGKYPDAFLFKLARTDAAIATDQLGDRPAEDGDDVGAHPYFCCEIGGGMVPSYHRRIHMFPEDVEAVSLVKLGSGNNLQGYYMYHGGTNPEGRLSTLQESQATSYWNDVPVKSYDFQAPLGEFGQVREPYHRLRRLHLFLQDWGATLATLPARLPEARPASPADTATLRWAVRTDGKTGFLFASHYQRLQPMPARPDVQFEIRLSSGPLRFPLEPITVPADARFVWPFHMDLGGAPLLYATAQPICRVEEDGVTYVVFGETPGVGAELVFGKGVVIEATTGRAEETSHGVRVRDVEPGTGAAVRLRTPSGARAVVVLLDEAASLTCWKASWLGRERLFLTAAGLMMDGNALRLEAEAGVPLAVSVFPAPGAVTLDGIRQPGRSDGLFHRYAAPAPPAALPAVRLELVKPAGPARTIKMGSHKVAEAPTDAEFVEAAVWRIRLTGAPRDRDRLLRLRYEGDVARLTLGGRLLTDHFFNGRPFDLGLTRYAPEIYEKELLLHVLPFQKDAPIHFTPGFSPDLGGQPTVARVTGAQLVERQRVTLGPA